MRARRGDGAGFAFRSATERSTNRHFLPPIYDCMTHATVLSHPAAPRAARFARTAALARAAAPLLLAALAACGGDGPTGSSGQSSVHLRYGGSGNQGTINGTYQAEGDPSLTLPPITQTYALGQRVTGQTTLRVVSNVARSTQQTADFSWVTIPRLTVGSVAINGTCPGEDCAAVSLALEVSTSVAVSQAKYSCALDNGTIRITEIGDGRAKGTFSGTGRCLGRPGTEDLDQFTITDGTFDVKVIDVQS